MDQEKNSDSQAQILLPSTDLTQDITYFSNLGFQLNHIFPSDDPAVAMMSGHGINVRLDKNANHPPSTIYILTDYPEKISDGQSDLVAPNGTIFKVYPKTYQLDKPVTRHKFEVKQLQDNDSWIIGRAGMLYRDLIPDRLGGGIIASHISIPEGGPVPDVVHYHTIGFQLIFCYRGWVKLVYEDQGPPFILHAGDCVTQPPEIRHRVLESSDNLEVIEIGVPAEHLTTIDYEMELPTKEYLPDREFQNQRFCHHESKKSIWDSWYLSGFEYRDTGVNKATKNVASVHVIRVCDIDIEQPLVSHDADILFTFVMKGGMKLSTEDHGGHSLKKGDAYVIPPYLKYKITDYSEDLELLEVALPGNFRTTNYS